MCGIIAVLAKCGMLDTVLDGLTQLQNRGYDSVGLAASRTASDGIYCVKYASTNTHNSLDRLKESIDSQASPFRSVVAHTRWATHGPKTDVNAHPHQDQYGGFALVHNGIIENYSELREELSQQGFIFRSQTDTEVIVQLMAKFYAEHHDPQKAIEQAICRLSGTWALAIIHSQHPQKLWIARHGSPLLLGIHKDFFLVSSELSGFCNYIKEYISLNDLDVIEMSVNGHRLTFSKDLCIYQLRTKQENQILLTPQPYAHWMIREIKEQVESTRRSMNYGGRVTGGGDDQPGVRLRGLNDHREVLLGLNNLVLLGCGTSYHAAMWASYWYRRYKVFNTVSVYDGAEFEEQDIPRLGRTGFMLLSQSGETKDLHRCLDIAKQHSIMTIGVVNVPDSMIARETNCGIYLNAGREVAVASTKSFTSQCSVLMLILSWYLQHGRGHGGHERLVSDTMRLPGDIEEVFTNEPSIQVLAQELVSTQSLFVLGKGPDEAIARESCLKLKEISYIHAEGYSSSALKHGPFALIEPGMPVFVIDTLERHHDKNQNAEQEMLARGARVIPVGPRSRQLKVPANETYAGVLSNINFQLLAYHLSLLKGLNPDYPRNLAKVVTVE